jgi:hypothetical protein
MTSKKRLVVCCDGTWNEPGNRTNIWRLKNAIAPADPNGCEQWVYYDKGVGTERLERLRGGLLGYGLSRNLLDAYRWLIKHYAVGDEIWCFGFSRGAYTARSLCGFINCVGVMHHRDLQLVDGAYAYYRLTDEQRERSPFRTIMSDIVRYTDTVSIRMLGVFDTVGSLGVPLPYLKWLGNTNVQFHDTELSGIIENAYQALAIDERRGPFRPTLWTLPKDGGEAGQVMVRSAAGEMVEQKVVQVWFPGVHSDIGGGYDDKSFANVTLAWMLDAASSLGLGLRQEYVEREVAPNPLGSLHDSYTGGWRVVNLLPGMTKARPRAVGQKQRHDRGDHRIAGTELLHLSVDIRVRAEAAQLPEAQAPYRPVNVVDSEGKWLDSVGGLGMERRRAVRATGNGSCTIEGTPAELIDISRLGARLRPSAEITVEGQTLRLVMANDGEREARVVWQGDGELGLAFAEAA